VTELLQARGDPPQEHPVLSTLKNSGPLAGTTGITVFTLDTSNGSQLNRFT
jgi:hypothetical protein